MHTARTSGSSVGDAASTPVELGRGALSGQCFGGTFSQVYERVAPSMVAGPLASGSSHWWAAEVVTEHHGSE